MYKHVFSMKSRKSTDEVDSRTFIDSIDLKREKQSEEDFMSQYNIDRDAINDLLDEVLEMNKKNASLIK